MEAPLASDGTDADGRTRNRIIRYLGLPGHGYRPIAQYAYQPDAGTALADLAWVSPTELVSLERGFTAGVGNTIRVYTVSLRHAVDVTKTASLADAPAKAFVQKRPLFDLVNCPPSGAVAKE